MMKKMLAPIVGVHFEQYIIEPSYLHSDYFMI